jgi:hypothetical protein
MKEEFDHGALIEIRSVEEAVAISLPDGPGQNHKCLFTLARALLNLERWRLDQGKRSSNEADARKAFELWHEESSQWLRQG